MNVQSKRRLMVVAGIIIVVAIVALAMIGSMSAAQAVTVRDVVGGSVSQGQKVQVSGTVVTGSATTDEKGISFAIYDPDGEADATLPVRYEGAASSTFGNGVTAICTGRVDESGVLQAGELVTKCPSKYESATDALTVAQLLDYGESIVDKPVKVTGVIVDGQVAAIDAPIRFALEDAEDATGGIAAVTLPVVYAGAMPETIEGEYVVTGALSADGIFTATDVAQSDQSA